MKETKNCGNCIHEMPKETPGHIYCMARNRHTHVSFGTTCNTHVFKTNLVNIDPWRSNSVECHTCRKHGEQENHSLDERGECNLCGTTFKGYGL